MEYTLFGGTGLRVSRLGLGGAPLAGDFGPVEESEIERMIHEAIDLGINFIDTAPKYGMGESERRIGKALKDGKRDRVVLATKAVRGDLSYGYASTIRSAEESLKRLQTDWVDLLQLHDVEAQPFDMIINETIPAALKLREEGKARYLGVTTRDLPLLATFMRMGVFDSIQFYTRYMLIDHTAKDEILPLAADLNLGVINGSVLGLGLLAETPAPFLEPEFVQEAAVRMEKLRFLRCSEPRGLIEPGMRFSLTQPGIHVTLTGAATSAVLRMNAALCDGRGLDPDDQQRVFELFQGQKLFS